MKSAEKVLPANFESPKFFESCLPVDVLAERGIETLRFGPMRPVGLERPDGSRPHAVVQLRRENLLGDAFNLVGFQNRLTYPEQKRVFRLIPGLEDASFLHLGSVHRNSFLHTAELCDWDMSSKTIPNLYFAGQMTGVEGYTESAASGLYVAMQIFRKIKGQGPVRFPVETGIGALINFIMTASRPVPSNVNFGLFPPLELTRDQRKNPDRKRIKRQLIAQRAKQSFENFFWPLLPSLS